MVSSGAPAMTPFGSAVDPLVNCKTASESTDGSTATNVARSPLSSSANVSVRAVVTNAGLTAACRVNQQQQVRLGLAVPIEQ